MPAHAAALLSYARHNQLVCSSAALTSPVVQRLTRQTFQSLSLVRLALQPMLVLEQPPLSPEGECAAVLGFAQLAVGLVAPALVAAAHEASLFLEHQEQRLDAGLPPEAGWQAWLYERVACALVGARPLPMLLAGLWASMLAWEFWTAYARAAAHIS